LALIDSLEHGTRGTVLEGGSRSGKTWSCIFFLVMLCSENKGLVINVVKDTYNGFKTTLYNDFDKVLTMLGLWSPFELIKDVQSFRLFGNRINFIGADQPAKFHGAGCDYFWINEALDVQQAIFDQLEMRCRRAWILDYNPKVTDHWVYNRLEKRKDVHFVHSTLLDNPQVSRWEKTKIISYEPTPKNVAAGTADDYMWRVYGLGERCAQEGLIFPHITWIDEWPTDIERHWYGLDFGFTNEPSALVKIAAKDSDLYLQELLYSPTPTAKMLHEIIAPHVRDRLVWADSADRYAGTSGGEGMVKDLQRMGMRIFKAKKFSGSVTYGIDIMKRYRLNIVRSANFKKEADNYAWRSINGIQVNEPIGEFEHLWSAARYGCQMELEKRKGFTI